MFNLNYDIPLEAKVYTVIYKSLFYLNAKAKSIVLFSCTQHTFCDNMIQEFVSIFSLSNYWLIVSLETHSILHDTTICSEKRDPGVYYWEVHRKKRIKLKQKTLHLIKIIPRILLSQSEWWERWERLSTGCFLPIQLFSSEKINWYIKIQKCVLLSKIIDLN